MGCKRNLLSVQTMSAAVEKASVWIDAMVQREMRGPRDLKPAMERLSRRHRLPKSLFWSIRYHPPKDIFASVYLKLEAAYQAETKRQAELLKHEIEIATVMGGAAKAMAGASVAVAGDFLPQEEIEE